MSGATAEVLSQFAGRVYDNSLSSHSAHGGVTLFTPSELAMRNAPQWRDCILPTTQVLAP